MADAGHTGTLYLAKLDPENGGRFVAVVGRIVEYDGGYRFLSNVSGHKSSRKVWPSANSCIPRWTEKLGFLTLLDKEDFDAARGKAEGAR